MTLKSLLRPYATPYLLRWYHKTQAMVANCVYGFPSRRLRVIGVTGTNGKTTTCHLIAATLERGGYTVATLSTVAFQIGDQREVNALNMTTPNPWIIQRFLAKAVTAGAHVAVIETTSHAIDQERIWGIRYEGVVLTNLTHDHLDYHKTFDAYRATKLRLFAHQPRFSVINSDDPSASLFLGEAAYQHFTYALEVKADVTARKVLLEPTGSLFTVVTPVGQIAINLQLPGRFNVANALAAVAVGLSQGMSLELIKAALEAVSIIPGRMERVDVGQDFTVLIDYAHTPDAFEVIYGTLRSVTRGRILHVFGATGDRDRTKRPILGALAARNADCVIITNEEPYTEDPEKIIDEVTQGVQRGRPRLDKKSQGTGDTGEEQWWWRVPDRKEAIALALRTARKDDVVLITGMGDERFMTTSDGAGGLRRIPWHERRVVKDLLLGQLHKRKSS